jgi:hypothetical protein
LAEVAENDIFASPERDLAASEEDFKDLIQLAAVTK